MSSTCLPVLSLVLLAVIDGQALIAQALEQSAWNQWRGPGRDGHVPESAYPKAWPGKLELVWQCEVGRGYSSPIAAEGSVFTLTRRGDNEVVSAISLSSGQLLWESEYLAKIGINMYADGHGRWPRSTPLVHGDVLVTLGASAVLTAWDRNTGKEIWQFRRSGDVSTAELFCGTAMSPLLHAGRIYAHLGDDSGGELLALSLEDGEPLWRTSLEGPGYASPVLANFAGTPQLVTMTQERVIGVSLSDGRVLWSEAFKDQWNENIVTPIVHGERVIVGGVRRGTLALRPSPSAEDASAWQVEVDWVNRGTTLYMSSPVLVEDQLFGFSQKRRGTLVALNPENGDRLWDMEEPTENAALLWAGSQLLALTVGGELLVIDVEAEEFVVQHRFEVAEKPTWAHPLPLTDGLIVRDSDSLMRWRLQ